MPIHRFDIHIKIALNAAAAMQWRIRKPENLASSRARKHRKFSTERCYTRAVPRN